MISRLDWKRQGPEAITPEFWRVLQPGGLLAVGAWIQQDDIDWIHLRLRDFFPQVAEPGDNWPICYSRENPAGYRMILE